ncbi:MAG: biotin-dependent carboxyltransferase family protein [Gammaproteobacteria bacterium]|nr:biotin-dependent carboxyltransferase family protein [Gammaproteobacteria bacterium]
MTIVVERPGLQTTIQARPRVGQRHLGVPASGPADPLSMALANRLVGNSSFTAALETTLTGVTLKFCRDTFVAVTGATARCVLNDVAVPQHETIAVKIGDVLDVAAAEHGVRSYLAFDGGLEADVILGSASTYLPAGFGGHEGRALQRGDELALCNNAARVSPKVTPAEFRVPMLNAWTLRAGRSVETASISDPERLFDTHFTVANRSDRMGVKLEGEYFDTRSDGMMASVPVFPGTVQCPEDGSLFIMSVDAGTTGGYPRVAKVTRMDLHQLGQLRPGNRLTLIERTDADAARELAEKHAYWRTWLPDIADVI